MTNGDLQFPDAEKVLPSREKEVKPIQMDTSGKQARILIGDADPVYTLGLFQALVGAGYGVVVALHGTDAIAELRQPDSPRVAILDADLPGMEATQICQRVRDGGRDIYVILTSGAPPTTPGLVAGLESGADLVVPKAIPLAELLAYVRVGLRTTGRLRALAQGPPTGGKLTPDERI